MSSEKINPKDLLFLVSRSLDGDLSYAEQAELDLALAASVQLRDEADKLRVVAGWVKDRAVRVVQIDWDSQAKLVLAEIAESEPDDSVEAALKRMAAREPQYDPSALITAVMEQIAPARRRTHFAWRTMARIGVPLAAAAAIVWAVTATMYSPVKPLSGISMAIPKVVVEIGPAFSNTDKPVSVVMFAKPTERTAQAVDDDALSLGYMTLGSAPIAQIEESPL